jgi:hypothetical protein
MQTIDIVINIICAIIGAVLGSTITIIVKNKRQTIRGNKNIDTINQAGRDIKND